MSSLLPLIQSYLPHPILTLPSALSTHIASHPSNSLARYSFIEWYKNAQDPVHTVAPLLLISAGISYIVGLWTGNLSQIDRQWTLLPTLYSLHFTLYPFFNKYGSRCLENGGNVGRLVLMQICQIVWFVKLTSHTYRRGLYSLSDEDYRWTLFKKHMPGWFTQLFHLFFVIIIQCLLLCAVALPFHNVLITPTSPSSTTSLPYNLLLVDLLLFILTLLTLLYSFTADNQHFLYHEFKFTRPNSSETFYTPLNPFPMTLTPADVRRGFLSKGLFRWSRHPNFAGEMAYWAMIAVWPVLTGPGRGLRAVEGGWKEGLVLKQPLIAGLAYSCLFIASTTLTEFITANKYPTYTSYQSIVGQFTPQATLWKNIWATLRGNRKRLREEVFGGKIVGLKVEVEKKKR